MRARLTRDGGALRVIVAVASALLVPHMSSIAYVRVMTGFQA